MSESAPGPAEPTEDGRVARARAQREERREQILAAARRVFAEKGYHAASINDLVEAAGISRGTFYLYWPSKHDVFDEIIDDVFQRIHGCIEGIRLGPGNPGVMLQLRANAVRIVTLLLEDRDLPRILRRTAVGVDTELDHKLEQFYGALAELLERTLRLGIQHGVIREVDTHLIAQCVLGSAREVTAHLHSLPPDQVPSLDTIVDQLLAYNLRGLLAT